MIVRMKITKTGNDQFKIKNLYVRQDLLTQLNIR